MPEGDTIFRTAATLQRAIGGQVVTRFESIVPKLERVDLDTPIVGRTVERVESAGKWLLMHFSGGLTLLTHMLMSGSWHIYRPGERWQCGRQHMRIVIETPRMLAVAFDVPVAEFHTTESLAKRRGFSTLGPDLLAEEFDTETAIRNLQAQPEMEIASALLRQHVLAGIGNEFKSEVLFEARIHPFRRVDTLSMEEMRRILEVARRLLRDNVRQRSPLRRTTRRVEPGENLWVYNRSGQPCRKCGEPIVARRHTADGRLTFWCPRCQSA
ncbi:MAG TPA: DNA-formamidopyrimidine glycosylase family protein [Candidatus Solibacter sp.]|nr:DNA-formamidopyrimidine glycosylase family protein [Candidatus Solibacter sp.]